MERISHWMAWIAVAVIVLFAGLNWGTLTTESTLNLAVAQIQAPVGVILLGLTSLFIALFVVATLYSRINNLMETRRLHKEVRTAQDLADRAEASRLKDMQQLMVSEFRQLNERIARCESAVRGAETPQPGSHPVATL